MAREFPYGFKYEGAGLPVGRASVTVRKTKSGITKTGSVSKKAKTESTSYRGKELTKSERKKIREQNKTAETLKSKDLDKVESGKRAAKTRRIRQEEREDYAYGKGYGKGKKRGEKVGVVKGAAGTALLGSAIYSLGEKKKREDKKKSTKKKK